MMQAKNSVLYVSILFLQEEKVIRSSVEPNVHLNNTSALRSHLTRKKLHLLAKSDVVVMFFGETIAV
jgi:hypothetical protein